MKVVFKDNFTAELSQDEIILRNGEVEKLEIENLFNNNENLFLMRVVHETGKIDDFNISENIFVFDNKKFSIAETVKIYFLMLQVNNEVSENTKVNKSNELNLKIITDDEENISQKSVFISKVQKKYKLYNKKSEKYLDFFLVKNFGANFLALDDISFSLNRGDSLGLIGLNGSGKSTLANIIAGCSEQTNGIVKINGTVSSISISSAIDTRLTGVENIMQKGLLLGLKHSEIKRIMPIIIEFSELGPFINQQVKTYSSGMKAKLGFAISVNINPDIIVIDEALSVGDPTFTAKCLNKMNEFRKSGKTIVFVSHSMQIVKEFCNKVLWLEGGKMIAFGECNKVVEKYSEFIKNFNRKNEKDKMEFIDNIRKSQFA